MQKKMEKASQLEIKFVNWNSVFKRLKEQIERINMLHNLLEMEVEHYYK